MVINFVSWKLDCISDHVAFSPSILTGEVQLGRPDAEELGLDDQDHQPDGQPRSAHQLGVNRQVQEDPGADAKTNQW